MPRIRSAFVFVYIISSAARGQETQSLPWQWALWCVPFFMFILSLQSPCFMHLGHSMHSSACIFPRLERNACSFYIFSAFLIFIWNYNTDFLKKGQTGEISHFLIGSLRIFVYLLYVYVRMRLRNILQNDGFIRVEDFM